eukprot:TRINITY_DN116894_c0_g1_i1.p1 TRINITY_DN116894_c0_g1~~TRINITY_DN116894_c0_g1_i1.p1  ORF type:complete len:166 (+),score=32.38 TRINITY_DN116894_c0_g1_i1:71-568(+)
MPIDYSKWDNLGDSDDEPPPAAKTNSAKAPPSSDEDSLGLRHIDQLFRHTAVTSNDKKRAFQCWKRVRNRGKDMSKVAESLLGSGAGPLPQTCTSVTLGEHLFIYKVGFTGEIQWQKTLKASEHQMLQAEFPWSGMWNAGFNEEKPWESDVDAEPSMEDFDAARS